MSNRSETRNAIVNAMANASLFEIIQEARKHREDMITSANDGRDALVATANQQFVRVVINATVELGDSIEHMNDGDDDDNDDDDDE